MVNVFLNYLTELPAALLAGGLGCALLAHLVCLWAKGSLIAGSEGEAVTANYNENMAELIERERSAPGTYARTVEREYARTLDHLADADVLSAWADDSGTRAQVAYGAGTNHQYDSYGSPVY